MPALERHCLAHTEVAYPAPLGATASDAFVRGYWLLFPCNVQPSDQARPLLKTRRLACIGNFDSLGVQFEQNFKDNRDNSNFLAPFLLSRLCSRSDGSISIPTTSCHPQHHSGSPADHQSGLPNHNPEGHRNKLSGSGSDSLERRRSRHHCAR